MSLQLQVGLTASRLQSRLLEPIRGLTPPTLVQISSTKVLLETRFADVWWPIFRVFETTKVAMKRLSATYANFAIKYRDCHELYPMTIVLSVPEE